MKYMLWIPQDSHLIQFGNQGRLPGGVILKSRAGRQALKDL